jgi:ABC-type amino acid transport substrate-binding protein
MRWIIALLLGAFVISGAAPASAWDLDDIKKRGRLLAGTSGNVKPIIYANERNELVGYEVDVVRFVEKRIGVPIELTALDWKGVLPGLQTGRFDAVFSNVNINPERKSAFEFSIPYSRAVVTTIIRNDVANVNSYKDLKGLRVGGVTGGGDSGIPAEEINQKFGPYKSYTGYTGFAEMMADLKIGRLDAVIHTDLTASQWIKENPGVARIVGEPYAVRFVGIPMRKGAVNLKQQIDEAIREMRRQGLLDKWAMQYFGLENFSAQLIDHVP